MIRYKILYTIDNGRTYRAVIAAPNVQSALNEIERLHVGCTVSEWVIVPPRAAQIAAVVASSTQTPPKREAPDPAPLVRCSRCGYQYDESMVWERHPLAARPVCTMCAIELDWVVQQP